MRRFDESLVIVDRAVGVGVLNQCAENPLVEVERMVIAHHDPEIERFRARLDDFDDLRMAVLRDEENFAAFLVLEPVAHHHGFRRGGGLVQKRGVGDFQSGQIAHHRLEVQQHFQAALRNLRLVGRVLGVPAGIFQDVALNHRGRDAVVVTQADIGTEDLVLRGDRAEFVQNAEFTPASG